MVAFSGQATPRRKCWWPEI